MKCKYCGKEVLRGSEYCPGCGKSLTEKPVNKIFKIFAAASILDLLKYIITFSASLYSAVLYTSGQTTENQSIINILIYFALAIAAVSYLIKLYGSVKNRKENIHFTYVIFTVLASLILSILSYTVIPEDGNLRNMVALVINAVDVFSVIMIIYAVKDFAIQARKKELAEKCKSSTKIFIILGVVGCLLLSIAIPAIYIIYFILLRQAMKEL